MSNDIKNLIEKYQNSLQAYLQGGGEIALFNAHILGRTFLAQHLRILDIAEIHKEVLMTTLHQMSICPTICQMINRCMVFLLEIYSAYDMAERGYLETSAQLHDLKKFRQEMSRLEQMNIIGEMAAGVGHEIRNPMTAIRGFLQLLTAKNNYNDVQEYFELMIEELDRANAIITEFLSLARNKIVNLNKQNLNDILEALKPLLEATLLQSDNYLEIQLSEIPDLLLHEKEIRQLILNLVRNGREAMAGSRGKTLTIRTYLEGDEVVLAVQDQGKGIEPHILEKLGTPFLTTKENGTGLGLPVCYNIAAHHKATIDVETGPEGTTFYVRFKHPQFNSETV